VRVRRLGEHHELRHDLCLAQEPRVDAFHACPEGRELAERGLDRCDDAWVDGALEQV